MKRLMMFAMLLGGVGLAATAFGGAAQAQAQDQNVQRTPKDWNYVIKDGKRVPKTNRITNPDGSWREEIRQGNCVTIKEKTAQGVYKESRSCD